MAKAALSPNPRPITRNERGPLGISAHRFRVDIVSMLPSHAEVMVPGRPI